VSLSVECVWMDQAASDEGFERATVGMTVCLVVMLLYASAVTGVMVYDCRHKLRAARLKEADRQASLAHTANIISARTAVSSAMKPPPTCGGSQATERQQMKPRSAVSAPVKTPAAAGVRFNDGSPPADDITC